MSIHLSGVPRAPIPGADGPPAFRGEPGREGPGSGARAPIPGAQPPLVTEKATAADPIDTERPATEVEELRRAVAAASEEKRLRATERKAALRERERAIAAKEAEIEKVDRRLRVWRDRPDLALEDLGQYGVTFDMLARTVAAGGVGPEQLAAAEAAQARREVEELRRGLADRDRREQAERIAASRQEEASAIQAWQEELDQVVDPGRHPLVAHFGPQAFNLALTTAERMFRETGRVPRNDAILDEVERGLQADVDAAMAARRGTPGGPPGAKGAPAAGPQAGETAQQRRDRFLGTLSEILRGSTR